MSENGPAAETLDQARALDRAGRTIEVLILVKTTPNPSSTYEDTVCVAGIALSPGPIRWVRLYPIPFRHLDHEQKFPKYGRVRVKVSAPKHGDGRAESLRVDLRSLTNVQHYKPGRERDIIMASVPHTTTCDLMSGVRADANGPSLGLVDALDVKLTVEPHPGWSPRQQRILDRWQSQPALPLDGSEHVDAPPLENPPFKAWYSYRCTAPGCRGHRQGILDWELTALQRKARAKAAEPEEWIRGQFGGRILDPVRKQFLSLGNQAAATKRTAFSVLSVYYPKKTDWTRALNARAQQESTLF